MMSIQKKNSTKISANKKIVNAVINKLHQFKLQIAN